MKWTLVSAATALVVTLFVTLALWFPEYYKLWAAIGLFGAVFTYMLLKNPVVSPI
jgi:hypothetical protein